ncbi:hypothetical protein Q8A67_016034 [Cirrhinus molitorella]|uniref:Uncharacterized protein n=1 Tax=Cirrhinus molitorella TaxID=172907 RepID=A0AA88PQ65_9TELE|nr:hypothetical protein Q8A67_016034 [Cirrhinus molitorella]
MTLTSVREKGFPNFARGEVPVGSSRAFPNTLPSGPGGGVDARLCPFIFPQFHFGMGESSRRRVDRFLGRSSLALCGLFQSVLFGQEADVSHEPLGVVSCAKRTHVCGTVLLSSHHHHGNKKLPASSQQPSYYGNACYVMGLRSIKWLSGSRTLLFIISADYERERELRCDSRNLMNCSEGLSGIVSPHVGRISSSTSARGSSYLHVCVHLRRMCFYAQTDVGFAE